MTAQLAEFTNISVSYTFKAVKEQDKLPEVEYTEDTTGEGDDAVTVFRRKPIDAKFDVPTLAYFGINQAPEVDKDGVVSYAEKQLQMLFDSVVDTVKDFVKSLVVDGNDIPEGNLWEIIANKPASQRGRKAGTAATVAKITKEAKAAFLKLFEDRRKDLKKSQAGIVQQLEFFKHPKHADTKDVSFLNAVSANIDDLITAVTENEVELIGPVAEAMQRVIAEALDLKAANTDDLL